MAKELTSNKKRTESEKKTEVRKNGGQIYWNQF